MNVFDKAEIKCSTYNNITLKKIISYCNIITYMQIYLYIKIYCVHSTIPQYCGIFFILIN